MATVVSANLTCVWTTVAMLQVTVAMLQVTVLPSLQPSPSSSSFWLHCFDFNYLVEHITDSNWSQISEKSFASIVNNVVNFNITFVNIFLVTKPLSIDVQNQCGVT